MNICLKMVIPDQEILSIDSEIATEGNSSLSLSEAISEILGVLFKSKHAETIPKQLFNDEDCMERAADKDVYDGMVSYMKITSEDFDKLIQQQQKEQQQEKQQQKQQDQQQEQQQKHQQEKQEEKEQKKSQKKQLIVELHHKQQTKKQKPVVVENKTKINTQNYNSKQKNANLMGKNIAQDSEKTPLNSNKPPINKVPQNKTQSECCQLI